LGDVASVTSGVGSGTGALLGWRCSRGGKDTFGGVACLGCGRLLGHGLSYFRNVRDAVRVAVLATLVVKVPVVVLALAKRRTVAPGTRPSARVARPALIVLYPATASGVRYSCPSTRASETRVCRSSAAAVLLICVHPTRGSHE